MLWDRTRLVVVSLFIGGSAAAQDPGLDLRGFQPPLDPQSSLVLEPVATPRSGDFSATWLNSYAYRLVRVVDEHGSQVAVPVRHQLSYDVLMNIGVGKRWAFGMAAPGILYQTGDRVASDTWRPPTTALGDPSLEAKFVIVQKGELGGYGLAALSRMTVPLASPESGLGDNAVTAQGRLLGELDLILLSLRASVGAKLRTERRVFWGDQFGHSAPWAVGIALRPQAFGLDKQGRWQWFLDAHGAVALTPEFATKHSSPIALAASSRYALGSDLSALVGVEIPLNGALGTPSLRAIVGITWAPRFLDADGDGIPDDADDCPEGMPEDRDGFEDDDGCPDDDNDDDGIPDGVDRCPNVPEDLDGFEDVDGCPDPDNDKDGILDKEDACPGVAGVVSKSKKYNGCPAKDSDGDGILDDIDRCPDQPEDRDGRFDEDGCPDPDDDADGILDGDDDCPTERGPRRDQPGLNGCPDPDHDGDTYYGNFGDAYAMTDLFGEETGAVGTPRDRCPDEAEDFDGDRDDDGCPDPDPPKGKTTPLISLELSGTEGFVQFAHPLRWESPSSVDVATGDVVVLRAVAKELRLHREWSATLGIRPKTTHPEDVKLAEDRALHIVRMLQRLTLRDQSAKRGSFEEVARAPGAQQSGLGILLTSGAKRSGDRGTAATPTSPASATQPAAPPPAAPRP
jgi:OmpA-OmpF porin, OOP family